MGFQMYLGNLVIRAASYLWEWPNRVGCIFIESPQGGTPTPCSFFIRFDAEVGRDGGGEPSEETGADSGWQGNSEVCGVYCLRNIWGCSGKARWNFSARGWNTWLQVGSYIWPTQLGFGFPSNDESVSGEAMTHWEFWASKHVQPWSISNWSLVW